MLKAETCIVALGLQKNQLGKELRYFGVTNAKTQYLAAIYLQMYWEKKK